MLKATYRSKGSSTANTLLGCNCGCMILIVLVNLTLGAYCFDYSLAALFGTDVPWYLDVVAGLFLGELVIPVAVILWIVGISGVAFPIFGMLGIL